MWMDESRAHEGGELPPPSKSEPHPLKAFDNPPESLHSPSPWAAFLAWTALPVPLWLGMLGLLAAAGRRTCSQTALQDCNRSPVRPRPNETTYLKSDRLTTTWAHHLSQHIWIFRQFRCEASQEPGWGMIGSDGSPGLVRSAGTTLDHLNSLRPGSTLTYSKTSPPQRPATLHKKGPPGCCRAIARMGDLTYAQAGWDDSCRFRV